LIFISQSIFSLGSRRRLFRKLLSAGSVAFVFFISTLIIFDTTLQSPNRQIAATMRMTLIETVQILLFNRPAKEFFTNVALRGTLDLDYISIYNNLLAYF